MSKQFKQLSRVDGPPQKRSKTERPRENESTNSTVAPSLLKDARAVSFSRKGKEKAVAPTKVHLTKASAAAGGQGPSLPATFKVIAGSYEKLLYGIEGSLAAKDDSSNFELNLKAIFIFPAHVSCIKAVAASPGGGKWLATGSADEIVKVWDLRRRKEIGGLMHHEGSITQLNFPSRSHLISASEDGTLCLFRARDWSVLRSLKGHKGRVNCVAVHPSGKVALSVGQDKTLRMWDLMRGKGSASTKLGKEGEIVRWSSIGSSFVVQSQATIDVYSTDMVLLHTVTHPARLHDVRFCKRVQGSEEVLLVAAEDKKVTIYDVHDTEKPPIVVGELVGHTNRVKAVDVLEVALPSSLQSTKRSTMLVSTVSSDGRIHIYDLWALPLPDTSSSTKLEIQPIAHYDTKGSRLTCVTLAEGEQTSEAPTAKRKRSEEEDKGSGESQDEKEWAPQVEDDEGDDGSSSGDSNDAE